ASPSFLVDTFIFPGNSGSPVILRPEITSISGTPPQNVAYLIGIVRSYLPYADFAVSQQTHHLRISFEENSGLAEVLPTDYIDGAITDWRKTNQPKQ
ncbi:MAG: serine protease, partial [Terriglobia bacterium]